MKKKPSRPRTTTLGLSEADFRQHLVGQAAEIAPADVTALLSRADVLRERLSGERVAHPLLGQRARVALHLLADHARGACPQIPYHTVGTLAAALFYYLDPIDVVPDFIPGIGTADDALIFDVAWDIAQAGIARYMDWKGLSVPDDLPGAEAITLAVTRAAPAPRAARGRAATKGKARAKAEPEAPRARAKRTRGARRRPSR